MNYWKIALLLCVGLGAQAQDTFTPYAADEVPQTVADLWKDYDPRAEELAVKVLREWKADGVVTRYVTFKVGQFKGVEARIAAYYSFPENGKKVPAFVWAHGGGQRADRARGVYFAKQGFATIDINWLGREMEPEISENTDWGAVDPTQGPRFYSQAKRKGWKRGLEADAYSIDPVPSPRNNNWFLLVVAARRGISFLEQQAAVNAERIGMAGFSMGGTITAMTAIDPRVKAAAPFVGGTGFLHVDFPGLSRTSLSVHYPHHLELYANTVDPAAYWPLLRCPVMFISASNDFHAGFDRIYQSMALLPHKAWRVTTNLHENHRPGREQWVLLNKWFKLHLGREKQRIPQTPVSELAVEGQRARFTVTPDNREADLLATEIYYSYDPNPLTRFWIRAGVRPAGESWYTDVELHEKLPLYVFALCRYSLGETVELQQGSTSTMAINSLEQSIVPEDLDLKALAALPKTPVFEDFSKGLQDWGVRSGTDIITYKFQSPHIEFANKKLCLTIDPQGKKLSLRLNASSQFLGAGRDLGQFTCVKNISGDGPRDIIIDTGDFKGGKDAPLEWERIGRFQIGIVDVESKAKINFSTDMGRRVLQSIKMVDSQ